jgi:hypothetical protein
MRWRALDEATREVSAETAADCPVVALDQPGLASAGRRAIPAKFIKSRHLHPSALETASAFLRGLGNGRPTHEWAWYASRCACRTHAALVVGLSQCAPPQDRGFLHIGLHRLLRRGREECSREERKPPTTTRSPSERKANS